MKKTCLGITKKGGKCHQSQEKLNEKCPICLSKKNDMLILSCKHRLHTKCAEGLTNLMCPLCKSEEKKGWPPYLREKILANSIARQDEIEEEERQSLIEELHQQMLSQMTLFIQPPPQIEIMAAIQYLREHNLPLQYMPINICINIPTSQSQIQPGTLFMAIIGQILEQVQLEQEVQENIRNNEN